MDNKIYFDTETIDRLEKQQRVHLINSLGGFKSVSLVGTVDNLSNENLAIFSSIFHIGANPPLIALVFRPSPPERDTLKNIFLMMILWQWKNKCVFILLTV